MKPRDFLEQLDDEKIVAAIAEAERATSGEIRIYVSHRARADALAWARTRFEKLGMNKTKHRNAVLLYLVPRTRSFALVGDTGVHEKCGDAFWNEASAQLANGLKSGSATDALVATIEKIGDLLAEHFPATRGDTNELPNKIERGD